jgi:hypothetical protein
MYWDAYDMQSPKTGLPKRNTRELAVFTGIVIVSNYYLPNATERLLCDKTMPASGTHSLEPSLRGRGLRFSGSWSKVSSTQPATASASTAMVVRENSQTRRGGGSSEVPVNPALSYLHPFTVIPATLYRGNPVTPTPLE